MSSNEKMVRITNRARSVVGYDIPDMGNLHRNFAPGETKTISMDELRSLSWTPGGDYLLKHCFILADEEAVTELVGEHVEPEYYYGANEIKTLLTTGSLDQLKDCLDFAPDGVKEMIKDMAVKMELNDVRKRDAIKTKLGFDVTKAIEINHMSKESAPEEEKKSTRRAAPVEKVASTPSRRTTPITTTSVTIPKTANIKMSF